MTGKPDKNLKTISPVIIDNQGVFYRPGGCLELLLLKLAYILH
jgi:hypothetical protein